MTLLFAYNADELSGPVIDVTGNGHDIALGSNLTRVAGHTNTGMAKNNVGFPVVASPAVGQTTARSFMFWLKGAGNGTWIFRFYNIADDTGTFGLYLIGSTLNLRLRKGGSNTNTTFAFPGDGLDHHYAGTYDGTNARLYIDATLVATSTAVTAPLDNADRIEILEGSIVSQVMDDLRGYDEALTQPQIATLMATPVTAASDATAELASTLKKITSAIDGTVTSVAELGGTLKKGSFAADATVTAVAELGATLRKGQFASDATVTAVAELTGMLGRMTSHIVVTEDIPPEPAEAVLDAELKKMTGGVSSTVNPELLTQRSLTKAFIESSPVDIALVPRLEVRLPSGGTSMVSGSVRPIQTFRLIPMSHTERPVRSSATAAAADDGIQRRYDYTLLGEWNAEMRENDQWETNDGQLLVIDALVSYNGYERKAMIMSYGRSPSHV